MFVSQDQVKQAKLQMSKPKHVYQGSHLHVLNFPVDLLLQHWCVCVCVCLAAAWQEVEQKLEGGASGDPLSQGPIQYADKTPSTTMKSE